ncbi:hypothetical protein OVX87_32130 [Klebsiella pneumoniae]|nr:hypothetical protein [Klebsiella pneumoniae]MCY0629543.1 hypothetical protein [Klebsiella pneumoniae]
MPVNGQPILYAEGYATARSLTAATGFPVVMAIDAGNMRTIAEGFGQRFPDSPHFFMADMDLKKTITKTIFTLPFSPPVLSPAIRVSIWMKKN